MMSPDMHISVRPPIGFIVEGHGEHISYPGIVARICGVKNLHVPVANARGFGNILENLEEHLDDLIRSKHPFAVIVTVDLKDALNEGSWDGCAEVCHVISERISGWKESRSHAEAFKPMPEMYAVIVQIQKFESWWLADPRKLSALDLFNIDLNECIWHNVDIEVSSPTKWLIQRARRPINLKSPSLAQSILSSLDPLVMQNNSKSFSKFLREVQAAYSKWLFNVQAA